METGRVERLRQLLGKADPTGNGPGDGSEALEAPAGPPEARAVPSSLSPRCHHVQPLLALPRGFEVPAGAAPSRG